MTAVPPSSGVNIENIKMPCRFEYVYGNPSNEQTPTKATICFLNASENGFSQVSDYESVTKSMQFCVVQFIKTPIGVQVDSLFLPHNDAVIFAKNRLPFEVFIPVKDKAPLQIKVDDNFLLGEIPDGKLQETSDHLKNLFLGFVKVLQEESTKPSSDLSMKVSTAPITPKSKGGFWSRLFNKTS